MPQPRPGRLCRTWVAYYPEPMQISANVVEFTTCVVGRSSIQEYIKGRSEVYQKIFPNRNFPPNTLLIVAGLVNEGFLVEIKAVAALP